MLDYGPVAPVTYMVFLSLSSYFSKIAKDVSSRNACRFFNLHSSMVSPSYSFTISSHPCLAVSFLSPLKSKNLYIFFAKFIHSERLSKRRIHEPLNERTMNG